ncbi:TPA: amino-acid N-acetyltransferase [Pasteurella multocida]|uniref:amino-acid N-acetyltransferase n=1 Tax=Pasteurella multocida TaxID=747 RepID=UPI00027B220B|nr:amino-acid N-acetyltransferase [Pasteurella multocida]APB80351.1 amino-acid N-acetyltransferase [Pasteurella multocida]EJS84855.1 N-acetylglutamate synthase [Pasteurella multocida subsp. multocida str. P52VAC]EPE76017.1 N-acetylglutamate synthase [Pasteurella multocida 1500C]ERL41805.1 N-acetylglutamate synthase [Pasteurella multocida subsp. multocida str. PMTB]KEP93158.1 N-acetylglutamate synthase [Pasteurella multocida subsp. multocida VTCCBAA264]
MRSTELVHWFRQSTPYVNMHRGKTFVIMLDGDTIACPNFVNIINDISLLHSLGIKLVLVFGARYQINELLQQHQIESVYHKNIRITDLTSLELVKQAVGKLNYDIASRLSLRLPHSPLIDVVSGNFVLAQPIGVDDGIDYQLSGKIRRINTESIQQQLDRDAIVLIGPIAPSVTGESFNLPFEEIASQLAIKLKAEKLIGFSATQGILDENNQTISDLLPQDAELYLDKLIQQNQYHSSQARFLQAAIEACRFGIKRSHLISYEEDGSLLQELFTRDGVGTQLSMEHSETIRLATVSDIPALLELIRPLEQQGILVKRSREQLEMEISQYTIIDRDGVIIACAALNCYADEKMAEMACVAVHPDYRNSSRGDILLEAIQKRAKQLGIEKLFVLTTRTVHWFQERGFQLAEIADLPDKKRQHYNYQRRSKILIQALQNKKG